MPQTFLADISATRSQFESHKYVSVRELAVRRKLSPFTVYRWTKSQPERLPRFTRVHGRILFHEHDVVAWFAALRQQIEDQASVVYFDGVHGHMASNGGAA